MDRYQKLRKSKRNKQLEDYVATHPEESLTEVGEAFNISKQRVYQILHPTSKPQNQIEKAATGVAA